MNKTLCRVALTCALFSSSAQLFPAEGWRFTLRPEDSRFTVDVGRAGFLKMFGHDHLIEVRRFGGSVSWEPDAPERTSIHIVVEAASLTVVDEESDEEERAQIQADMEAKALDLENHPQIEFVSEATSLKEGGGGYEGRVTGRLTLRGISKSVTIPLSLAVDGRRLHAQGAFEIKGKDFGVPQVSVAGGSVKTSDDLTLTFDLVAERDD